jgi:heat shock protein HslJ
MNRWLIRPIAIVWVVGAMVVACVAQPPTAPVSLDPNAPAIHGTPWLWTNSSIAGAEVIADPTKYTLTFASDGTFSAQVDCNQVSGTFTETEANGITITPGPSTMAACPEPSLADIYLAGLSSATRVQIAADRLVLTGPDGEMEFAPTPSPS